MTANLLFSANISMLFTELPFLERIDQARIEGFDAVECHFPYAIKIADLKARLDANGLVMNALNTAPGNRPGDWGTAAMPGRAPEFRAQLAAALDYAKALAIPTIHCMSGVLPESERAAMRPVFIDNMRRASEAARLANVVLLVEPLNSRDKPNYFVSTSDEIIALLEEIDRDNVKLLFDVYHIQIMEGDITRRLRRHFPRIGHIQIASVPERHEPDDGEIAYGFVLDEIAGLGWQGYIGCEYRPRRPGSQGYQWLRARRAGTR
jgi:hydroxypyruvate isomerase